MRFSRSLLPAFFLLLLPIAVAALDLNLLTASALVLIAMLWRWALVAAGLTGVPAERELRLETISASHFVEKVRWCMDRLGVPYREQSNVATLGAFYLGRTVPKLHLPTGLVTSTIGNSADILRYLWGRYAAEYGEQAAFLEPGVAALEWERRLDDYGVLLQRWIYFRILPHRQFTLRAWGAYDGALPFWQRFLIIVLFPLQRALMRRAFRLTPGGDVRNDARIAALLDEIEAHFMAGAQTLLGGSEISFVDITFAALSSLWANPPQFAAGRCEAVRSAPDQYPASLARDMQALRRRYPHVSAFIDGLYREERGRSA